MTPLRQLFIDTLHRRGLAKSTIRNYVTAIKAITQHFNCSPLDFTKMHIDSYILFLLKEKKRAPATTPAATGTVLRVRQRSVSNG